MDLGILKSPWVWGSGLAIGILIVMSKGSSGGNDLTLPIAGLASMTELNKAGMALVAQQDKNATQRSIAFTEKDKAIQLGFQNVLLNMYQADAVLTSKRIESNAGVTNARIQSYTFLDADRRGNQTRRYLAELDLSAVKYRTSASVKIAKIGSSTEKFKAVTGAVTSLGGTALKAAFA